MTNKNVLVAGGAGFLGSHLVESLVADGNNVTVIDNLCTSTIDNIKHISDIEFINQDICSISYLNHRKRYHEIWNLACPASPPLYQKDPLFTLDTNYLGTRNLLRLACEHDAKFFQASTSEVYGDPEVHPQPESYRGNVDPTSIRSCYDEGKRIAETLCVEYSRMHKAETRIVRIFNTYGPRLSDSDGRVVSNFISQALSNDPITIYGDGKQTRSFCYVDDLIRGFRLLMDSDANAEPVNLGNPSEFSILELAEIVLELTESKSKIVFKDLPKDDPKQRKPNITKAKLLLDWQPQIDLRQGLNRMINFARQAR